MHWQDLILSIGNFIFLIALVPSVMSPNKPALATSLMTGLCLITFSGVYFSLHLWLSMVVVLLTAALWLTLALQKYRQV